MGLKEGQGPAWAPNRACGLEEAPSQSAFLPLVPPGPFSGEKRNYVGARGFQPGPQDQQYSGPGAPCLAVTWAPEKYWLLWLTELFFRFEPAPPFDSDPAEQGKRFLGSASPPGRGVQSAAGRRPSAFPVQAKRACPPRDWWGRGGASPSPGVGWRKGRLLRGAPWGVAEDLGATWPAKRVLQAPK